MNKSDTFSALRVAACFCAVALVAACAATSDQAPALLSGEGPVYPPGAKAEGVEGFVEVAYDIAKDGRVVNARVLDSQPVGVFDAAALEAVRSWRFTARREAARNVQSRVEFVLDEPDEYRNL